MYFLKVNNKNTNLQAIKKTINVTLWLNFVMSKVLEM